MAIIRHKAYGFSIHLVPERWRTKEDHQYAENYIISWKWDYRDAAGYRGTQSRNKRTTHKNAVAFSKRHGVDMPRLTL